MAPTQTSVSHHIDTATTIIARDIPIHKNNPFNIEASNRGATTKAAASWPTRTRRAGTIGTVRRLICTVSMVAYIRPIIIDALASSPAFVRTVLVTGGAGYIGSHTCLELLEQQAKDAQYMYRVVVVDNLDNSSEESLRRVRKLVSSCTAATGEGGTTTTNGGSSSSDVASRLIFRHCDIRDTEALEAVLDEFPDITSCIHFAGLKAVGESVSKPLSYYECNIGGTVNLLQLLTKRNITKFVFSSSATVYGEPEMLPLVESARLQATNPYGRTKLFIEEILRDLYASNPIWNILILRYFNPIGAHPSGEIGEDPQGIPNNLMPFIAQVCVGRREKLSVFGDDYDTKDGTGVRDYIHVVDLAKGHVAALDKLYSTVDLGCKAVNLGTGQGISVLDLVEGMGKATGKPVPYEISPRRPGDVATVYADATLANNLLKWKAELGVDEMCADTWRWQKNNPYGYTEQQPVQEEEVAEEREPQAVVEGET